MSFPTTEFPMPAGIQNKIHIIIDITSDATGGLGFTVPRAGRVVGCSVVATATSSSGTVLVSKAGSAITNAVACAALNTAAVATTITVANATFAAGNEIRVVTNGATDRGTVVIDFAVDEVDMTAV